MGKKADARIPVPTGVSLASNEHRLRRLGDHILVLGPKSRTVVLLPLYLTAVLAILVVLLDPTPVVARTPRGTVGCLGAAVLTYLVMLAVTRPLWARAAFDRELGTFTLTGWRFRPPMIYRLEDVRAVHLSPAEFRAGGEDSGGWYAYQINLVIDGLPHSRLNLLDCGDPAALSRLGSELAGFLGVPYEDGRDRSQPGG
jgi:hypothetical protein